MVQNAANPGRGPRGGYISAPGALMWPKLRRRDRFGAFCTPRNRPCRAGECPPHDLGRPTASYTTPGAGNNTCSIDSARRGSAAVRITTPFNHGSSDEVSNRVGICVTIDVNA